jgi:hypothetical protein
MIIYVTHIERFIQCWMRHLSLASLFKWIVYALESTHKAQDINSSIPFRVSFVMRGFQCSLYLDNLMKLALEISYKDPSMAVEQQPSSELKLLERYFIYKTQDEVITTTTFLKGKLMAFFQLLLLPIEIAQDLYRMMSIEMQQPDQLLRSSSFMRNQFEWCFSMPTSNETAPVIYSHPSITGKLPSSGTCAFIVDEEHALCRFVVCFWNPIRTEGVLLPLQYHFSHRKVGIWDENSSEDDESLPSTVNTSALLALMTHEKTEQKTALNLNRYLSQWRQEALSQHDCTYILEYIIERLLMFPWSDLRSFVQP